MISQAPLYHFIVSAESPTQIVESGLLKHLLFALPRVQLKVTILVDNHAVYNTERLLTTNGFQMWESWKRLRSKIQVTSKSLNAVDRLLEQKHKEKLVFLSSKGFNVQTIQSVATYLTDDHQKVVIDGFTLQDGLAKLTRETISYAYTTLGTKAHSYSPTYAIFDQVLVAHHNSSKEVAA
jgi:hypothetical protein